MASTGHSAFPASSSYRLLACPGSFALSQAVDTGERRSTVFSAEGTLAHSVSEAALFSGVDPSSSLGRTFQADGFTFAADEEFVEGVQTYVDFIRGLIALGYLIMLETRVSPAVHWQGLPDLGIELFGTADCIAYHPDTGKLLIVDLKFGKGVAVEVQGNPQLLYYAAGAMHPDMLNYLLRAHNLPPLPADWEPSSVEAIVVQPRAFHPAGPIRSETYTATEVRDWARVTLYNGVERVLTDNGKTLHAGEHCRFCPALAHCPAAEAHSVKLAAAAFANAPTDNVPAEEQAPGLPVIPPGHIDDDKLGELLDMIAVAKPYIAAIEALAETRLKAHHPVKGWKVVPTRTKRVWDGDEPAIVTELHNLGIAPGNYTETRLRTPAQTEKMLGKKEFAKLAHLVTQSKAGVTLAPEGDPRTRLSATRTAQEAFGITPAIPPANP